jgi:hypothetical protein
VRKKVVFRHHERLSWVPGGFFSIEFLKEELSGMGIRSGCQSSWTEICRFVRWWRLPRPYQIPIPHTEKGRFAAKGGRFDAEKPP